MLRRSTKNETYKFNTNTNANWSLSPFIEQLLFPYEAYRYEQKLQYDSCERQRREYF